jgi:predicted Zn-dependent protease
MQLSGCSQSSEKKVFTASPFQPPIEVQQATDSVTAYAREVGGAATFEEFKVIYEYFIELHPNSAPLQMDFQALYNNFDKREECQERFREMYQQHPDSAFYIFLYARTLVGPEVDTLFNKAYEVDSNYYWSNFALASRLFSYPPYDTARAIHLYERAIEIDNSYPAPFRQIAILHKAQGNYDEALQFADLFAVASQNPLTPLLLQAEIWKLRDNNDTAETLLRAYVAENPNDLAARQALVDLYQEQKRFDVALEQQYELTTLSRSRMEGFVKIAELYCELGNSDSAIAYVVAAAQQGYDDHHRIAGSEVFQQLKDDERYDDMMAFLKDQYSKHTADRLASFAALADSLKRAALADTVSEQLPRVTLETRSGESVSLESLKGEPAVIIFWSSWSNQSAGVLYLMREFNGLKPQGVDVVAINMWDDEPEKAEKYLRDYGFDYQLITVSDYVAEQFGVFGVPTVLIADADGVVRYRNEGYQSSLDQIMLWQVESLN